MARRTRSPHPGVVLIPPQGEHATWRARYTDPDTGRATKVRLDPLELRTAEARRQWAIRKSKALAKRAMAIDDGAPRATGTTITDALGRFFRDHPSLSPGTVELYRIAANKLAAWAEGSGIKSSDDLTGQALRAFRATLVREPKHAVVRGGKRGRKAPSAEPRAPITVNRELRTVGTILGYLRKLGLLPRLTSDGLADALEKLKVPPARTDYLKPAELRRLLEAAVRHDGETFVLTRAELAGERPAGSTPRYPPIAPLIVGAVITGMRIGHLLALQWEHVDLDALDHHGNVVGEIVPPVGSATKRTGVIGLEVSPAFRKLLAAMRLKCGGEGSVFGLTRDESKAGLRRVIREYGAPKRATWQTFRKTCGSYLTNAPGIFGAASAWQSARQLGHSVEVAEKHYVGVIRGIPPEARTLEAAMQIETQLAQVIASVGATRATVRETG